MPTASSRRSDSTHSGNVIDIWLLDHSGHGLLDRSIGKLKVRVFFPNLLEIKVRAIQVFLDECQGARVSHAGGGHIEVRMAGDDESGRGYLGVRMDFNQLRIFFFRF